MITGKVPFPGTAVHVVFPLILNREIDWPKDMEIDPACKSLIEELLVVEPNDRLGARTGKNNMEALKKHPFLDGIKYDEDLLTSKEIKFLIKETEPMEVRRRRISTVTN